MHNFATENSAKDLATEALRLAREFGPSVSPSLPALSLIARGKAAAAHAVIARGPALTPRA